MLWTLQSYIFREMGKTFLLTSVGLMCVLGLGGGVFNMIELEGVSTMQLLKLMGLVLPVSAALTLPIAVLYSATVTYGRMSADNEFVACRSGGINIHVLLLPTLVFSLVSACCSFFFLNYAIPGIVGNLDRLIGSDLPRLIEQKLSSPERLNLKNEQFRIYAEGHAVQKNENDPQAPAHLELSRVAFVESSRGEWKRVGLARHVDIQFRIDGESAAVAAGMSDLTMLEYERGWLESKREVVGPFTLPQTVPLKVKWLDLGKLLYYRRHPSEFPGITRDVDRLRSGIARSFFYEDLKAAFVRTGTVEFGDQTLSYAVSAPKVIPDKETGRPIFVDGVKIIERRDGRIVREIEADSASIQSTKQQDGPVTIYLQADGNVTIRYASQPDRPVFRNRERLESMEVPAAYVEKAGQIPSAQLLDPNMPLAGLRQKARDDRDKIIADVGELSRDIEGVLHSRLAFSFSVFVLVILGAVLGIVFRGTQTLVAFGISFIPSIFVIATIIAGKQLIDNPATVQTGIAVIWLGIILVAGVDLFVMTKVLRR